MMAAVRLPTAASSAAASLAGTNLTPGSSGSNSVRYLGCPVMESAPRLLDHLSAADREHFALVGLLGGVVGDDDARGGLGFLFQALDDHAIVRAGLKQFIADQPDMQVAGEAATGSEAIALSRAVKYGAWLQEPDGTVPAFADFDRAAARAVIDGALARADERGAWLTPDEVTALLAATRIPTPPIAFAHTAEEAAVAAEKLGFPVALKLASDTITHKSDVGGVVLGIQDEAGARSASATRASKVSNKRRFGSFNVMRSASPSVSAARRASARRISGPVDNGVGSPSVRSMMPTRWPCLASLASVPPMSAP